MSPMSWYCGSQDTFTVDGDARSSYDRHAWNVSTPMNLHTYTLIMIVRLWARFPWEIITPFGSEVDPEVYCKNAMSLFSTSSSGLSLLGLCCRVDTEDFPLRITSSTWIQFKVGHLEVLLQSLWSNHIGDLTQVLAFRGTYVENNALMPSTFFAKLYWEFVRTTWADEFDWMLTKWWRSFFSLRGSANEWIYEQTADIDTARICTCSIAWRKDRNSYQSHHETRK